jgi:hypothetical protein
MPAWALSSAPKTSTPEKTGESANEAIGDAVVRDAVDQVRAASPGASIAAAGGLKKQMNLQSTPTPMLSEPRLCAERI